MIWENNRNDGDGRDFLKNDIRDVGSTPDLVLVFLVNLVHWYLVHWYPLVPIAL